MCHWSEYGVEEILRLQKLNQGNFINARERLMTIGVIGNNKNKIREIPWEV